MGRPSLPDDEELVRLARAGWSYAAIAKEYGVTREAVSQRFARRKLAPPKVKKFADYIPWVIRTGHEHAVENRILRLYARRDMGETLSPEEGKRLDRYVHKLNQAGAVIDYDRELGWVFEDRRPEDDGGIIRRPASDEVRRTG